MTCWCLKVMYPSVNCRVKRVEYIQSRIFIYIYGKLSIKSLPLTINIFSSNEKIIFYRLLINITDPWFHDSPNRGTLSYFTSFGKVKFPKLPCKVVVKNYKQPIYKLHEFLQLHFSSRAKSLKHVKIKF